jgi:hypothetical protein
VQRRGEEEEKDMMTDPSPRPQRRLPLRFRLTLCLDLLLEVLWQLLIDELRNMSFSSPLVDETSESPCASLQLKLVRGGKGAGEEKTEVVEEVGSGNWDGGGKGKEEGGVERDEILLRGS